ncbi:MAG TPA: VCBS repeat-containing protein, partial [Candidatus Limnocylindria bacterium]|nr:VCBS repeat-containing protein [Candidatus Limnocylindria bacterium]
MHTIRTQRRKWALLTLVAFGQFIGNAAEPTFTEVTATVTPGGLPQIGFSSVAWGDYDNDGRLDFLLTGLFFTSTQNPDGSGSTYANYTSQLWRNTGSGFTNVTATVAPGLLEVGGESVVWTDYDNDGRLDFLLTGSGLWRNTESGFTNVTATVAPGIGGGGSVASGDYDNDGRVDFLIPGSGLWRNTESGFTNMTAGVAPGLPGVYVGAAAWGDYDNDGRLDFLITGGIPRQNDQDDDFPFTPISQLWRNTGSGFANVTATVAPGLPGSFYGSVAWGDYDNDGRLDFLLSGQLWRNVGTGFVNVTPTVAPGLPGGAYSSAAW